MHMKLANGLVKGLLTCVLGGVALGADAPAEYRSDFEKGEAGSVPEDFLVLNGAYGVKKDGGNGVLELPGEPLDSFGFLAGPEGATRVQARIKGDVTGQRRPEFGVGLGGAAGWRVWVMPAVGEVQLVRNDDVHKVAKFEWKAGAWTHLKLQAKQTGDVWAVQGKAWLEGAKEPESWNVTLETKEGVTGRPSVWTIPYSSKPMQVDDVVAGQAK
jgi:hypothetical protein